MDDRQEIKRRVQVGNFVANNGKVLRTINILRYSYNRLRGVRSALPDMDDDEYLDSVNYLTEMGYITLRDAETKAPCAYGLADVNWRDLEGKLTATGIRLLAFAVADPLVEV